MIGCIFVKIILAICGLGSMIVGYYIPAFQITERSWQIELRLTVFNPNGRKVVYPNHRCIPNLRVCALKVTAQSWALFGSTYSCEPAFCTWKSSSWSTGKQLLRFHFFGQAYIYGSDANYAHGDASHQIRSAKFGLAWAMKSRWTRPVY